MTTPPGDLVAKPTALELIDGPVTDASLRRYLDGLPDPSIEVDLVVPYDRGDLISLLHEKGRVLSTEYVEDGTLVNARISSDLEAQFAPYRVPAGALGA